MATERALRHGVIWRETSHGTDGRERLRRFHAVPPTWAPPPGPAAGSCPFCQDRRGRRSSAAAGRAATDSSDKSGPLLRRPSPRRSGEGFRRFRRLLPWRRPRFSPGVLSVLSVPSSREGQEFASERKPHEKVRPAWSGGRPRGLVRRAKSRNPRVEVSHNVPLGSADRRSTVPGGCLGSRPARGTGSVREREGFRAHRGGVGRERSPPNQRLCNPKSAGVPATISWIHPQLRRSTAGRRFTAASPRRGRVVPPDPILRARVGGDLRKTCHELPLGATCCRKVHRRWPRGGWEGVMEEPGRPSVGCSPGTVRRVLCEHRPVGAGQFRCSESTILRVFRRLRPTPSPLTLKEDTIRASPIPTRSGR
jgi:hypothetical protein